MRFNELVNAPEHVVVALQAIDRWQAIEALVDALVARGRIAGADRDAVVAAVRSREETMSTGVGNGIGIPHAAIAQVENVEGMLGISDHGIDFDALDGAPVHIVMLFVVPQQQFQEHLDTLADIARVLCDPTVRHAIQSARTPADVLAAIQSSCVATQSQP
jgi:mannitol/fructose-specific phosphotransferase system IIA component (Ntr-type)